jgi:hypothetical protein
MRPRGLTVQAQLRDRRTDRANAITKDPSKRWVAVVDAVGHPPAAGPTTGEANDRGIRMSEAEAREGLALFKLEEAEGGNVERIPLEAELSELIGRPRTGCEPGYLTPQCAHRTANG